MIGRATGSRARRPDGQHRLRVGFDNYRFVTVIIPMATPFLATPFLATPFLVTPVLVTPVLVKCEDFVSRNDTA